MYSGFQSTPMREGERELGRFGCVESVVSIHAHA